VFPPFPPYVGTNVGSGDTYGYELVMTYEMTDAWRLRGSYTFLVEDLEYGQFGWPYPGVPGANPRNQFFIHSAWDLSERTHLDMILRYVDNLAIGVPHYCVMDVRLAHEFQNGLEVAIVGQNLFDNHHLEFVDLLNLSTEVPQGVYGMVTWRY